MTELEYATKRIEILELATNDLLSYLKAKYSINSQDFVMIDQIHQNAICASNRLEEEKNAHT